MNKKEWHTFFEQKGRTAIYHYSQRKLCHGCHRPIINSNETGYCQNCLGSSYYMFNKTGNGQGRESKAHKRLKSKAIKFLKNMGCKQIREEIKVACSKGFVRVDVIGIKGNNYIAVECGGCLKRKLYKASSVISQLYILPYGETSPFPWKPRTEVCALCGHNVNR